ncbi:MAG TPA: VOC family protein [Gemmatimonadaceae bacterium]|nr:VOC family protein [Gemmatimonadaceae bacterium]
MSATQRGAQSAMKKLTPVIMVEAIEPCLGFWERLGFEKTAEVPDGDRLGFVILLKDSVEVMYQTHESIDKDSAGLVPRTRGHGAALFIEVDDVESVARALDGTEIVVPRRKTFYGMDEIGVREPGGHVVMFAQPVG